MCYILEAEYVLVNILAKKNLSEGIDVADIKCFRDRFQKRAKLEDLSVYVDISNDSVRETVGMYKNLFLWNGQKIYKRSEINIQSFNRNLPVTIAHALETIEI